MKTRRIAWAVLVLLLCASFLSIVAFASSFSDGSGGTVELEVTNADVSSDGILTKRIYGSQKTSFGITSGQRKDVTITIKNNNAFDVKLSGPMTFNIVGGKFQLSGTGYYKINSESEVKKENCTDVINADYIIEAGKSMTIKLTSPGGNDCYTEISWPIVAKKYVTYDINFAPAEHGSYAVDGVAITETTTKGIEGATGAELSATPDEGYVCVGFADATTGKMVLGMDSTQTTTFYPGSSMTIVPVFVQGLTETPYLIGTDSYYYTWESAMVAGRGGIVILNQNYTLPTTLTENGLTAAGNYVTGTDGALTYTVPTGTSLLVPYDSNNVFRGVATRYTLEKMDLQATDFPTSPEHSIIWVRAEAENPPTEYRRLTLPANTHLVVNGSLEVSGQSQALGKGHWGKYGLIQMEQGSKITVNNGATLFSWGFIRGNGTVEAMPGSSVYEPFSIADYPAGGVGTMNDMNNNNILAFKEYTVHGVEVPLTIHYNTSHYIYFCISGYNVGYNTYHVPFAGNNDTSLIKLAEGATLTKSYKDGRMQLTFSGDATFNAFTIEISALIYTYKLDINKTGFAVSSSWDVLIKGGSDVVSKVSMPLLAGSNVTIEEGATLEIASGKNFYIFDAEDDPSNATADAKLDVNGTVVVNGGLYTTTNGAEITSSKGTGKVIQNTQGTATSVAIMKDNASSDTYAINQAWLLNGDNTTYVKTADNTTIPNTYTYTDEKWVCETHTPGEWVTDSEPTCAVAGTKHTTCTVCFTQITESIPPTGNHTYIAGEYIWSSDGKSCTVTGSCACGETETATASISSAEKTPATCEAMGWTTYTAVFSETWAATQTKDVQDIANLGHSFTNYVTNNDATCTEDGTETAKCDRCDVTDTRTEEGSALDHSFTNYASNNDATCTEDGTETAKCDRCDETHTRTEEGSALDHSFTNYASNNDATCTEDGTETAKCDRCDVTDTRTDADSKLNHSFTKYESNGDATCTADGTKTAKCDRCDATDVVADVGSALKHSFTNYVSDGNATCTADGTKTAKCDRCDVTDTIADEGSKLGHAYEAPVITWIEGETVSATATVTCNVCEDGTEGKTLNVPAENVDVTAGEPVVGNCQTKSSITYTATATYGDLTSTDAKTVYGELGKHALIFHAANDATCETPGNSEYWTCSGCAKYFSDAEGKTEIAENSWIIPALNHVGTTVTYTDNGDGTHKVVCACGDVIGTESHSYDETNGECVCGAVKEPEEMTDDRLVFAVKGISFQDYIGFQTGVYDSVAKPYDRIYVLMNGVELSGIPFSGLQVFDAKIVSTEMTKEITMTLYGEKNGVTYRGETFTSSVEQLALERIAYYESKGNDAMCRVFVDMLNYGAAVQAEYASENTNLPNANLGNYTKYATQTDPALEKGISIEGTGVVKHFSFAVSYQSTLEIQLGFYTNAYEARYTVDGMTTVIPGSEFTHLGGNYYVVRVPVVAKNARREYTIGLYEPGTDNLVSAVYLGSLEGFAKDRIDNNKNVAVMNAMMKYTDAIIAAYSN